MNKSMPNSCGACGSNTLDNKGFGTEQIELELKELFPDFLRKVETIINRIITASPFKVIFNFLK